MSEPNLYEAPRTEELVARDRGHDPEAGTSLAGSFLQLGERRNFTARWLLWNLVVSVAGAVGILLLSALAALALQQRLGFGVPVYSLLFLGIVVSCALVLCHQGFPQIEGWDPVALARESGGFTVDLSFVPRLSGSVLELRDTADDVGVLRVDGSALCFEGDRVRLRLERADVRSVGRRSQVQARLLGLGSDVRVDLLHPLSGKEVLCFNVRARLHGPGTVRKAHRLKGKVDGWFEGDEG